MANITFLSFLLFSMCHSIHVAVYSWLNCSFFTLITVYKCPKSLKVPVVTVGGVVATDVTVVGTGVLTVVCDSVVNVVGVVVVSVQNTKSHAENSNSVN